MNLTQDLHVGHQISKSVDGNNWSQSRNSYWRNVTACQSESHSTQTTSAAAHWL